MRYRIKQSIRNKLLVYLCLLSLFFVVLSVVVTNVSLEKFYLSSLERILIEKKNIIESMDSGNPNYFLEIEKISRESNLQLTIMDIHGQTIYSTLPMPRPEHQAAEEQGFDLHNQLFFNDGFKDLDEKEYIIDIQSEVNLDVENLILRSKFKGEKTYIIMTIPINAIEEGVSISNRLFLFIGMINLVIGVTLAYFFSNKITKPILQLNDQAKKMKNFEFAQIETINSEDEVGELGKTINELSQKLDKTLNELKEANSRLEKDNEAKAAIDNMRKTFISDVSHELKTPIALIQGYAEGLVYNVNDDEENKNYYCNVIKDEALKMNLLVKQLLNLSQLESDGVDLEKAAIDIVELTNNLIVKYKGMLEEDDIIIELNFESEIRVCADELMLERIIDNYMTNAITHVKFDKIIRISIEETSDKVRWKIFNSGEHIPEESIANIWQRFYKVDKARTRAFGGTGLGLSIVKAIQERQHNGYGVMNVDRGVAFWFDIDVASK